MIFRDFTRNLEKNKISMNRKIAHQNFIIFLILLQLQHFIR